MARLLTCVTLICAPLAAEAQFGRRNKMQGEASGIADATRPRAHAAALGLENSHRAASPSVCRERTPFPFPGALDGPYCFLFFTTSIAARTRSPRRLSVTSDFRIQSTRTCLRLGMLQGPLPSALLHSLRTGWHAFS